jgi:hypothetical protein
VVGRNRLLNKVLTSKEPKSVETRGPFSKFEGQFTTPPPFFSFLFFLLFFGKLILNPTARQLARLKKFLESAEATRTVRCAVGTNKDG